MEGRAMQEGSKSLVPGVLAIAILACPGARAAGGPVAPLPAAGEKPAAGGPEVPDPSRDASVSLRGILAYAELNSPILAIARARTGLGDAEMEAAAVLLQNNPELRGAFGPRSGTEGVGHDVQISIEQRFEIAGERRLRLDAARAFRDLTLLELEEARWLVHRLVHAAYSSAIVERERATAATQLLAFTERMLEIARRRHAAGDISAIAVKLAENELAQARQSKISAEASYRAARLALAELSGWPADCPPEPSGRLEPPRDAPGAARLLEIARQHNPTLRARAQAVREAESRVALADREARPEPSLGLSYARESEPGGGPGSKANIGLVTLAIPIPSWQRNQGERARARADAAIARAESDAFDRTLRAQIVRAADALDAAAERVRAYGTEIIPAFEKNRELLRLAFELGELDLLELMVARGRFLEVQRDALSAYADYHDAVARLEELVGTELWADEATEARP
jgi:cobalt-zinc-cadmium efflux system outer membrane protein